MGPDPNTDVLAPRFLLFLSHLYGAVLLLCTPLIAAETLTRLLWHRSDVTGKTGDQMLMDPDGERCLFWDVAKDEESGEEEEEEDGGKDMRLSHGVSYICCLSLWFIIALDVRWPRRLEEVWTSLCLQTTDSLVRCLPALFSPPFVTLNPFLVMAFSLLLLIFLLVSTSLQRRHRCPALKLKTRQQNRGVNGDSGGCGLVPVPPAPSEPVHPRMPVSAGAQRVDQEKTESSCAAPKACSWSSAQMSTLRHADFVLISPERFSAGQERGATEAGTPLTFTTETRMNSQRRRQHVWPWRGFPCPEVNIIIGFMGVLFIFVLPLILSVNILLIRTIETLLELSIKTVALPHSKHKRHFFTLSP